MKTALTFLIAASGILITQAQEQQVEVSPLSLQITYQAQESKWDKTEPGLQMKLLLKAKEGLGIAEPEMFMKNVPLEVKDGSGKPMGKIQNCRYGQKDVEDSDQELTCSFDVKKMPAAGNTEVALEGTLPVLVLEKPVKTAPTAFDVKANTSFQVGELSFKVKKANDSEMTLVITEGAKAAPYGLQFIDADGKEAKLERGMWMSNSFGGKSTTEVTYRLDKKYDKLNVIVDTWEKSTKTDVPVKLKMGLGAPAK